jgi:RimJ/RimL family protein N-acetyltransferase
MIVESERLYFRPFTENDFELLYQMRGSPVVMQYIPGGARSYKQVRQDLLEAIAHQVKYGYSKWACFLKSTDEFVGRAGFSRMDNGQVEVGYGFLPEYWGQGFATEALTALLAWAGDNIDIPELTAFASKDNLASKRVLKKCGMQFYKQDLVKDMPCDFYYKRQDNLTISYGRALTDHELKYVENRFSEIAYQLRQMPPIESFCINLYNERQLTATVYGSIYYGCMHIDTIFVDESLRGKGYGRELMDKAENLARDKGCSFITITTMDWEARGFYEKLGYQFEYERGGYMNDAVLYGLKKEIMNSNRFLF